MESTVEYFVGRLGAGIIKPVVYDTALCAWIPSLYNPTNPEFPECLEWLKTKQLSDGSWGSEKPLYIYGNILSTLAAIIALKKWNSKRINDIMIGRGEQSLIVLIEKLREENLLNPAIETLFPYLLSEAKQLKLNIPFEMFGENKIFAKRLKIMSEYQRKYGWSIKTRLRFQLEILNGLTMTSDKELFRVDPILVESDGSVMSTLSSTAYYLKSYREEYGRDEPLTYNFIKTLIDSNNGAVPNFHPFECWELGFSLCILLNSGFPSDHRVLKPALNRLQSIWNEKNGFVGATRHMVADCDDISAFVYVLNCCQIKSPINSLQVLLNFFRDNHFCCFLDETEENRKSISLNINALIALKSFPTNKLIEKIIPKVVDWIKTEISDEKLVFSRDKWHISPYYAISRLIFAFHSLDNRLSQKCVDLLISDQKNDFGWGLCDSTLEETSLASLALCFWFKADINSMTDKNLEILKSIQYFFDTFGGRREVELWIARELYYPTIIVEMIITSAKYSLKQTIYKLNT